VLQLSNYTADVVFSVEKAFYKADEVVRFQVKRKDYILLPQISLVDYNLMDTLKEDYETTYEINTKQLRIRQRGCQRWNVSFLYSVNGSKVSNLYCAKAKRMIFIHR
jgi:hypothetical protein